MFITFWLSAVPFQQQQQQQQQPPPQQQQPSPQEPGQRGRRGFFGLRRLFSSEVRNTPTEEHPHVVSTVGPMKKL
jgi:hypothetical protein